MVSFMKSGQIPRRLRVVEQIDSTWLEEEAYAVENVLVTRSLLLHKFSDCRVNVSVTTC
jgi:hypothetical protein